MTTLAVVGSTEFAHPQGFVIAARIISEHFTALEPDKTVSGEAPGIDTLCKILSEIAGIDYEGFPPKVWNWHKGFKPRNILIAENCTDLLRISCKESKTYGSGWTADYAEKLGRNVRRFEI